MQRIIFSAAPLSPELVDFQVQTSLDCKTKLCDHSLDKEPRNFNLISFSYFSNVDFRYAVLLAYRSFCSFFSFIANTSPAGSEFMIETQTLTFRDGHHSNSVIEVNNAHQLEWPLCRIQLRNSSFVTAQFAEDRVLRHVVTELRDCVESPIFPFFLPFPSGWAGARTDLPPPPLNSENILQTGS